MASGASTLGGIDEGRKEATLEEVGGGVGVEEAGGASAGRSSSGAVCRGAAGYEHRGRTKGERYHGMGRRVTGKGKRERKKGQ